MLSRGRAVSIAAILSAVLLLIFMEARKPSAKEIFNHENNAGQQRSAAIARSASTVVMVSPAYVNTSWRSIRGIPGGKTNDAIEVYNFLKRCSASKQFGKFLASERANERSPFFNDLAFDSLSETSKVRLKEKLDRYAQDSTECISYERMYSDEVQVQQLYAVALDAASHGSREAAACFLSGVFGDSPLGTEQATKIRDMYTLNAMHLARAGISLGDWNIVAAAQVASRSTDGVTSSGGFSAETAYLLSRLMQLGAARTGDGAAYGKDASDIGILAMPAQVISWDELARQTFITNFGSVSRDSGEINFTKMCE
jgi:hypothetical protein